MKINKFHTVLSYITPLKLGIYSSPVNPVLEVTLRKGVLQLDSSDSNYSFGSLHVIFSQTFHHIQLEKLKVSNCLLLGLGAGSIINLVRNKYRLNFPITVAEVDPVVIQLAKMYFNLEQYTNLEIINQEAFNYVKSTKELYDLVIIDLYINDEVPEQFHSEEFVNALKLICKKGALVLFNKMLKNDRQMEQYNQLVYHMAKTFTPINFFSVKINQVENKIICANVR